jgi:AraC-like DNA-binding protein
LVPCFITTHKGSDDLRALFFAPIPESAARLLAISSRTLKRRLQESGASYQKLLDESRRRDNMHLLNDPSLSISTIAHRIGFQDPAHFTRAFRTWTGQSPSQFRARRGK